MVRDRSKGSNEDNEAKLVRAARLLNWITVAVVVSSSLGVYYSLTQSREAMELDQRPWLNLHFGVEDRPVLIVGSAPSTTLRVSNIGKTPARSINAGSMVNVLSIRDRVPVEGDAFQNIFTQSILQVNDDLHIPIQRSDTLFAVDPSSGLVLGIAQKNAVPLTEKEKEDLESGKDYLAIHGRIDFEDIFMKWHEVRFCFPMVYNDAVPNVESKSCTDYSDVLDIPPPKKPSHN